MFLLNQFFEHDLVTELQPFLRWLVVIICLATTTVLLSYKRGKAKYRILPSIFAYALTLAMISDPILIMTGYEKQVDFTEILGRWFILAVLFAHRGNVMGPFKHPKYPKFFNKLIKYYETKKIKNQ